LLAAMAGVGAAAQGQVTIDHRWSNTDAQSLIGLPMGSHKTIVDKQGNLKWSQWSLKRKPLDVPIGFSMQMDGELAIEGFSASVHADNPNPVKLEMESQTLYRERYPFVVTKLKAAGLELEEVAFAVDPDESPDLLPVTGSGGRAMDVVRVVVRNVGPEPRTFLLKLSGRSRNLPGHVNGRTLVTRGGELVADLGDVSEVPQKPLEEAIRQSTFVERDRSKDDALSLEVELPMAPGATKKLTLRLPYEYPATRKSELSNADGDVLLAKAVTQWDELWARGTKVELPQKELNDFYYSSIAYVLILTEYDAAGDLWALDGPAVYRQYWGRGEYFQARAMEVAGFLEPARQSVEHAFHIMNDDGEWDGPPTSGWPAWDNAGGNAGAVWDYYLFTGDKAWLAKAYPYLLRASEWIRAHREETTLEDVKGIPEGAAPVKRMLTGSKCRTEPVPELKPGEKTYWYGLLPWSYGDSGLPEGHSYSHNFLAAYAEKVAGEAAGVLGKTADGDWLNKEYSAYTTDIRESVRRSVGLETITTKYLPAMPTYPEGAYSQTFLAVFPTQIYSANDPLVTGLIERMEKEEQQGVPTNVAWAGPAGVWAGESMNMAETYLLRGEKKKATDMLVAAMNHSYTTNVWKEEILVNVDAPRACDTPHSKRANMEGTGDMPEAWANANLVLFLRDMLLNEREGKLHLLAGLMPEWVPVGKTLSLADAPVTTGGTVSLKVEHLSEKNWRVTVDPKGRTREFVAHLPVEGAVTVDGKAVAAKYEVPAIAAGKTAVIEVLAR